MKRKIAILLSLVMAFSLLPMSLAAAEENNETAIINFAIWRLLPAEQRQIAAINALWQVILRAEIEVEVEAEESEECEEVPETELRPLSDLADDLKEDATFQPGLTGDAREAAVQRELIEQFLLDGTNVDLSGTIMFFEFAEIGP